jgi:hypothetical protein
LSFSIYQPVTYFGHVLLTLHPPPLVDLLCCGLDQLPGALHHLVKQDVKLLTAEIVLDDCVRRMR